MNYRTDPRSKNQLSILGFGCMRLPHRFKQSSKFDIDKSEKLIMAAIDGGINYFDTAFAYMNSEEVLGEVWRRNPGTREKIYLATKMPHSRCHRYEDFDRFFDIQLARLATDYIDYYMIHNIGSSQALKRLLSLGVDKWLTAQKENGRIKQVGFSFHGVQHEFLQMLTMYDWDFTMIQYNYMNEDYQAGRIGLQKAHEMGIAVMVMEPLLGGTLATGLPKKAQKILADANNSLSPAGWAFDWLFSQPEPTVVLSGMNNFAQLEENMAVAANAALEKTDGEKAAALAAIAKAVAVFREAYKIPCTECNYCLPCPQHVNIPASFTAYNVSYAAGFTTGMMQYVVGTAMLNTKANYSGRNCNRCGQCEKKCPQKIEIIKSLEKVTKRMEPAIIRALVHFKGRRMR
ncbi:MAG: aldo/keto reductase [Lachnospiraceae bacterium]|jgi:predicted aldo/keto reductase-like oxidoreductase|nr:aldo/keto reductase [Lachnospiraceae bacterium]